MQLLRISFVAMVEHAASPPKKGRPMSSEKTTTMEQLRQLISSDGQEESASTSLPAPAASPLGTDYEAGGTTPTAERIEMARKAEERIADAAKRST